MEEYHLLIFKFNYTDNFYCLWPVYFKSDIYNLCGRQEKDILQKIKSELETYTEISSIKIILNKLANLKECQTTMNSILSENDNDSSAKVKFLEIQQQLKLNSEPNLKYDNSNYSRVMIKKIRFPIRIRARQFEFFLDELELPLIVINSQINFKNGKYNY